MTQAVCLHSDQEKFDSLVKSNKYKQLGNSVTFADGIRVPVEIRNVFAK